MNAENNFCWDNAISRRSSYSLCTNLILSDLSGSFTYMIEYLLGNRKLNCLEMLTLDTSQSIKVSSIVVNECNTIPKNKECVLSSSEIINFAPLLWWESSGLSASWILQWKLICFNFTHFKIKFYLDTVWGKYQIREHRK